MVSWSVLQTISHSIHAWSLGDFYRNVVQVYWDVRFRLLHQSDTGPSPGLFGVVTPILNLCLVSAVTRCIVAFSAVTLACSSWQYSHQVGSLMRWFKMVASHILHIEANLRSIDDYINDACEIALESGDVTAEVLPRD